MTAREKSELLRRLHQAPELLVLVNVWDAASARTVAAVPGCRALATASWSIAAAHGLPDGEAMSRDAMLTAVERIARAVDLPVSADLEGGYGTSAAAVGETVAGAIEAGAVGCNLEDGTPQGLRPAGEHAERVAAAREAGDRAGVPVVINARTDVFLAQFGAPGEREALATPSGPPLAELERLGVARVSVGPGSLGVAMAALAAAAETLLAHGPTPSELAFRP